MGVRTPTKKREGRRRGEGGNVPQRIPNSKVTKKTSGRERSVSQSPHHSGRGKIYLRQQRGKRGEKSVVFPSVKRYCNVGEKRPDYQLPLTTNKEEEEKEKKEEEEVVVVVGP